MSLLKKLSIIVLLNFGNIISMESETVKLSVLDKLQPAILYHKIKQQKRFIDLHCPIEILDKISPYLTHNQTYDANMGLLFAWLSLEKPGQIKDLDLSSIRNIACSYIISHAKKYALGQWKSVLRKVFPEQLQEKKASNIITLYTNSKATILEQNDTVLKNEILLLNEKKISREKYLALKLIPKLYENVCSLHSENFSREKLLNIALDLAWINDYINERKDMVFKINRKYWLDIDKHSYFIQESFNYFLDSNPHVSPLRYILERSDIPVHKILPFFSKSGVIGINTLSFAIHLDKIPLGIAYKLRSFQPFVHAGRLKNLLDLPAHDAAHAQWYLINRSKNYSISCNNLLKKLVDDYNTYSYKTHLFAYMFLIFYITHELIDIKKESFAETSKDFVTYLKPEHPYDNQKDSDSIRRITFDIIDLLNILKTFYKQDTPVFMEMQNLYVTKDSLLQSNSGTISSAQISALHEYINQKLNSIWENFKQDYPDNVKQAFCFER